MGFLNGRIARWKGMFLFNFARDVFTAELLFRDCINMCTPSVVDQSSWFVSHLCQHLVLLDLNLFFLMCSPLFSSLILNGIFVNLKFPYIPSSLSVFSVLIYWFVYLLTGAFVTLSLNNCHSFISLEIWLSHSYCTFMENWQLFLALCCYILCSIHILKEFYNFFQLSQSTLFSVENVWLLGASHLCNTEFICEH